MKGTLLFCLFFFLTTLARADSLFLCLLDENHHELLSVPMRENSQFGLRYRHSVATTLVEEWFFVVKDGIVLDRTVYHDFGAGLPHNPEKGQKMECLNGTIQISNYHRKLPQFDVRVGRIAEHTLLLPQKEIPLDSLSAAGKAITFLVKEKPCSLPETSLGESPKAP